MNPNSSESIIELAKALSKCQGAMKSVPKNATNPFYKTRYADLDAIWEMCRKPLTENGLSIVQTTVEINDHLYLDTMLLHASGEYLRTQLPLYPTGLDPQSVGSAITYARRYSMSAMLGVSADEDDDAEQATSHETTRAREANPPIGGAPRSPRPVPPGSSDTPVLTLDQLQATLAAENMPWQSFQIAVLGKSWAEFHKTRGASPAVALNIWEAWKKAHPQAQEAPTASPAGAANPEDSPTP